MASKFSDRLKITSAAVVQVGSMNDDLRNSIYNFIYGLLDNHRASLIIGMLGEHFFKQPKHEISKFNESSKKWFWEQFVGLKWHEVYDLLEFSIDNSEWLTAGEYKPPTLKRLANEILNRELAGYRFVQGILSPITNNSEMAAIEQVVKEAESHGLAGVRTHIESALELLGKKPIPDYRNSIKESISAVESAAKSISGVSGGGLDAALNELTKHTEIHKALLMGFKNLYGYSSNESGIRHAMIDDSKVGFDEAKFMLVACSAAAHFLIAKANEAGLLKT